MSAQDQTAAATGDIAPSQIFVTDTQGQQEAIEIRPGTTLMQAITDAGFADLLALCGGMCSCATCHVYVDDAFAGQLPPMGEDEQELLALSEQRQDNSRLSCQILVSDELRGLKVTIAPGD